MIIGNPNRINYYDRYQQIITDYNSEQDRTKIEKTFMDLMNLANSLDEEEQRYVSKISKQEMTGPIKVRSLFFCSKKRMLQNRNIRLYDQ